MAKDKAYLSTVAKSVEQISDADVGVIKADAATGGTSLVAVQGTDGVKFYSVETTATGGGTTSLEVTEIDVTLLGVTGLSIANFGID